MKVGDEILYVPDICHALKPDDVTGEFPWVIGVKERGGAIREVVGEELINRLQKAKKNNSPIGKEGIELLRPRVFWPAIVKGVNSDGTVDIDVNTPNSAVTLHCIVKIDDTGKTHHTAHAKVVAEPVVIDDENPN